MSDVIQLVTGGAGFLGSHLCDRLTGDGNHVICIDNLSTGRFENIAHLCRRPNFEFIQHDIVDPLRINCDIDEIYNLACPASPAKYGIDPVRTFRTCVIGSMNMLDLAKNKTARILQASTSEVYGDPRVTPQSEAYLGNVNTCGPRACYDEGKRGAETLFHDYARMFGLSTRIARIFNTYGPRMAPDDGRVVSNFIVQALLGENLTIHGTGLQTRSFCYVDDLVEGLMRLMAAPDTCSAPVNLGNPKEFTVLELAELVRKKLGSAVSYVHIDLPTDDPQQRKPDISRAQAQLGWRPEISLSVGLDRTIRYFVEQLAIDRTGFRAVA